MSQSNGGVGTTSRLTLYPMLAAPGGQVNFYAFDPSVGYDDPNIGGFYSFKVEEILPGRKPTISQAIIKFRDMGVCVVTLQLTGVSENNFSVATQQTQAKWGNPSPTYRLMTAVVGLNFPACFDPQFSIYRNPGSGPCSIAKIVLCGRVEVKQEFA